MADYALSDFSLQTNQKAERKYLVTAVEVDNEIVVIGAGVEDSSIEFNPDTETITDILGITETTVNKVEQSQDMEPMTIRGGNKLLFKLEDINQRGANSEYSLFTVYIIRAYLNEGTDEEPAYHAEKHLNCTIYPQSLGGSATVDMPISISFSGDKVLGTTNAYKYSDTIIFTEN